MDWNSQKRLGKHPPRPQSRLMKRGSVLEGNLQSPGENVDELLELLSSLREDLPTPLHSPVIEEQSRNAYGSSWRQKNLSREVELASSESSRTHPTSEGNYSRAALSKESAKPRTVRFACTERYPATCGHPQDNIDKYELCTQWDCRKEDSSGIQQRKRECSPPAGTIQHQSHTPSQKSQSIRTRHNEFGALSSKLQGRKQACHDRDWTDYIDVDHTSHSCQGKNESFLELQSILNSSWTSASLHRSMLDLELSEQLLTYELRPWSANSVDDFSPLETLEPAAENNLDVSASYNAKMSCSFQYQQPREPCCDSGIIDLSTNTPVNKEGPVTNPIHQSDTVINDRLSSVLGRPHLEASNSANATLPQNKPGSCSKIKGNYMDSVFSVPGVILDKYQDENYILPKSLSQHRFSNGKTSTERRLSKCYAPSFSKGMTQNERYVDTRNSYSHPTGPKSVNSALSVYRMTQSTEVPHCLFLRERFAVKENVIESTCRDTTGGTGWCSPHLMCHLGSGDGHATFVEKGLERQITQTQVPHSLREDSSLLDQRVTALPSSTMYVIEDCASHDSGGNHWDKRQEDAAGGRGLTADHQFSRLPDSLEVWSSNSVLTIEERFLENCRLRLLLWCLRTWHHRHKCHIAAHHQHSRRLLKKGLSALRWAVTMQHMQIDTMTTKRRAMLLSQCFHRWKARFELEQLSAFRPSLDSDVSVEALRRRLIQPSNSLLLRTAYCIWRRHVQGLQLIRAAHIHYHLTLLFNHWLEWRRMKLIREARAQQELQAQLHHEHKLKSWALMSWSSAWDRACMAQAHYRTYRLAAVWRRWTVRLCWAQKRLQQERWGELLHRRALLQFRFCCWRARVEQHCRARDRQYRITRSAIQRWHCIVQLRRLEHLCHRAEQMLAKRTLTASLRRWCQVKASAAMEQSQVERARHLLARRKLQAMFSSWCLRARARRGARLLLERVQKTQLLHCLQAWRSVLHHRSVWVYYCARQKALAQRGCLQQWRRALELRGLHRAFVTLVFEKRRERRTRGRRKELRWEGDLWGDSEPVTSPPFRANSSIDGFLLLHQAFHTWREGTHKIQLARACHEAHEQKKARVALQRWHRLAQQALVVKVHKFHTRVAKLDSPTSPGSDSSSSVYPSLGAMITSLQRALTVTERCSSQGEPQLSHTDPECTHGMELISCTPCTFWHTDQEHPQLVFSPLDCHTFREQAEHVDLTKADGAVCLQDQSGLTHKGSQRLKRVAVRALGRIVHGPLAVTFCQWRVLVRMGREQRSLLHSVREVRNQAVLSWAFRTWRTGKLYSAAADKHQEKALLACAMREWRGSVCRQKGKVILQRRAEHFRLTCLLSHTFSAWQKKGRVKLMCCQPEDAALLERRAEWMLRRMDKQRLQSSFSLWAAQFRQNLAVSTYHRRVVITRVFVAWEMLAWLDQERRALVVEQLRRRRCRVVLELWRTLMEQRQEISRRRARRLTLMAKEILQRWRSYMQNKRDLLQLLCDHVERKRRVMKMRSLLSWAQETVRLRRADASARQSLKSRYLQQWHSKAVYGARVRHTVKVLEEQRTHRALQRAFLLWRGQWRRAALRLLGLVRAAAHNWRQRALLSRAETHHDTWLTSHTLLCWREAQVHQRKTKGHVQGIAQVWLQRTRQSCAHQQVALAFLQHSQRIGLAEAFRRWATAYRSSLTSKAFHTHQQCRRVLLAWHRVSAMTMTHRCKVSCFQADSRVRLTTFYFGLWHSELQQACCRLTILDQNLNKKHLQVLAACMQYWRAATRGRIMQRNINRAQLQKLFACWREKTEVMKAANMLYVRRERRGAQRSLAMWLHWAKENKALRQMGEAVWHWVRGRKVSSTFYVWVRVFQHHKEASQLNRAHLLLRCLREWKLAVDTRRHFLSAVQGQLCSLRLYAAFTTWRKYALSQQALHFKTQKVRLRQERRLLIISLRAWHHQVQAHKCRSLYLSKKYLSRWAQKVLTKHSRNCTETARSRLSRKYLKRWRQWVLVQKSERKFTRLFWITWRNQTAASVLFRHMYAHKLQEQAWLTWRKRRIRTRVSMAFATQHSRALLAQAFSMWRDHTLWPTSVRSCWSLTDGQSSKKQHSSSQSHV